MSLEKLVDTPPVHRLASAVAGLARPAEVLVVVVPLPDPGSRDEVVDHFHQGEEHVLVGCLAAFVEPQRPLARKAAMLMDEPADRFILPVGALPIHASIAGPSVKVAQLDQRLDEGCPAAFQPDPVDALRGEGWTSPGTPSSACPHLPTYATLDP